MLRHYGYDRLVPTVPKGPDAGALTHLQKTRRRLRTTARSLGFSEAMPLPFLAPGDLTAADLSEAGIKLVNPLVAEESILRTSMLPGLLKAVRYNQSHQAQAGALFELGAITDPTISSDDVLPTEVERIAFIEFGFDESGSAATSAMQTIRSMFAVLGLDAQYINEAVDGLHPTRSASVKFRGKVIGGVGEVSPAVLERFKVNGRVAYIEIDMATIVDALAKPPKLAAVSKYPPSDVDLAFDVPESVQASSVEGTLRTAGGKELVSVELFDVFRKDDGSGSRSLAYSLRFQALDHTLKDDEVAKLRQRCIDDVEKKCGAKLRS